MNQPIILAYVAGSGAVTDNNGKRYDETGGANTNAGARGIGTVKGDQADPQFVLSPNASSNASFVLARGHIPNDPRDPIGMTFNFDLSIAQLEVLPSQQIRALRGYSAGFTGLSNTAVLPAASRGTSATAQPPVTSDATSPPAPPAPHRDATSRNPRHHSAAPFVS